MTDRDVYKALCTRTKNMNSDSRTQMDALLSQLSKPAVLENYTAFYLQLHPNNFYSSDLRQKHKMSQQPQFLCNTVVFKKSPGLRIPFM